MSLPGEERWLTPLAFGLWPLVVLPVARIYIDKPELGFVNAHTSKLSAGRTGNLQCSMVGEKGLVQSQCYFLLSSWVCFRLKIDLIETS